MLAGRLTLGALLLPLSAVAGTVSGRVVSFPDGAPLADVQVLARDPRGASAAGTTDSDGAFLIPEVDPGRVRVQAVPPPEMNRIGAYAGDVNAFCAADTFPLTDDEPVAGVVIELPVGGRIEGTLRDGDGAPVAGTVTAQGIDALNSGLRRVADADGAYVITGLASWVSAGEVLPGAYRVTGQLAGEPAFYAPGTWDIAAAEPVPAVREEATALDLTRPPGATLDGEVRFAGEAVVGASVEVHAQGFGSVWAGVTDAAGAWVAEDLPGAALTVRVRADGAAETWYGGAAGPTGAASFPGGEASSLGTLGLLNATSYALSVTGEGLSLAGNAQVAVSLEDGSPLRTLAVSLEGGVAALEGLPADPLFLTVRAPGWLAETTLVDGGGGEAEVDLRPSRALSVEVTDRVRARTLRGARVTAWDGDESIAEATTDGDGMATVVGLPDGAFTLSARWEPFCPADPGLVTRWSGDARDAAFADPVVSGRAEIIALALPSDRDRDAMDDVWELAWGLDWDRRDGEEDPDADGVVNLDEYRGYTDPWGPSDPISGCSLARTDPTCLPASLAGLLVLLVGAVRRRGGGRSPTPHASPVSLL